MKCRCSLHGRNVHAIGDEQFTQLDRILETYATDAGRIRADDVHGLVVDEQRAIGLDAELVQRGLVDFLVWLAQLDKTGDDTFGKKFFWKRLFYE